MDAKIILSIVQSLCGFILVVSIIKIRKKIK